MIIDSLITCPFFRFSKNPPFFSSAISGFPNVGNHLRNFFPILQQSQQFFCAAYTGPLKYIPQPRSLPSFYHSTSFNFFHNYKLQNSVLLPLNKWPRFHFLRSYSGCLCSTFTFFRLDLDVRWYNIQFTQTGIRFLYISNCSTASEGKRRLVFHILTWNTSFLFSFKDMRLVVHVTKTHICMPFANVFIYPSYFSFYLENDKYKNSVQ